MSSRWYLGEGRYGFAPPPLVGLVLACVFGVFSVLIVWLSAPAVLAGALAALPTGLAAVLSYRLARLGAWVAADRLVVVRLLGTNKFAWHEIRSITRGPSLVPGWDCLWVVDGSGPAARIGGTDAFAHLAPASATLDELALAMNLEVHARARATVSDEEAES